MVDRHPRHLWVGRYDVAILGFRFRVFLLIAFGVTATVGLSAAGRCGGTGRSMGWTMLILPYLIGLSLGLWDPGIPRWLPRPVAATDLGAT